MLEAQEVGFPSDILFKAEKDLELLLEEEEKFWKIRSREDWLKWGDRNIKWFHNKANQRRKRNEIVRIRDDGGIWEEDMDKIGSIASNYFKNMFSSFSPDKDCINQVLEGVNLAIQEKDNRMLTRPFTKADIEAALKTMNPTKASRTTVCMPSFSKPTGTLLGKTIRKSALIFSTTMLVQAL